MLKKPYRTHRAQVRPAPFTKLRSRDVQETLGAGIFAHLVLRVEDLTAAIPRNGVFQHAGGGRVRTTGILNIPWECPSPQ
jgi:hypothetical protein